MKRKTNLFYSEGPDSKFLTFSNYTESLTGNFLSTDTKIYPSAFLCLNLPELLISENKKKFINEYLIGYYENKLAFLRDKSIFDDKKPEDLLLPLAYLFDAIYKFCNEIDEETYVTEESLNDIITYVGDITEQDFNGTYTDTICIVDFSKNYQGTINVEHEDRIEGYSYDDYDSDVNNHLYGWMDKLDNFSEIYKPKYDFYENVTDDINQTVELGRYKYTSAFSNISIESVDVKSIIRFNVIIPLFDLTNINDHSYAYTDDNIVDQNLNINLQFNDDYKPTQRYVPLGIWFSESTIELQKDVNTGFSQSWSLLISSQFKPFPYSKVLNNEANTNADMNAFPTFAAIMSKQNEIMENFSKFTSVLNYQNNEIKNIESTISNVSYQENLDKLKREFINFQYEMTNKFNSFKQDVQQMIDNLAWNATK